MGGFYNHYGWDIAHYSWDKDDEGYHFTVVDINRMRFGKVDMKDGCTALCRLWGPKRFIELIARSYATARGFNQDEAVRLTMQTRAAFWTRFRKRHPVDFPLEL